MRVDEADYSSADSTGAREPAVSKESPSHTGDNSQNIDLGEPEDDDLLELNAETRQQSQSQLQTGTQI